MKCLDCFWSNSISSICTFVISTKRLWTSSGIHRHWTGFCNLKFLFLCSTGRDESFLVGQFEKEKGFKFYNIEKKKGLTDQNKKVRLLFWLRLLYVSLWGIYPQWISVLEGREFLTPFVYYTRELNLHSKSEVWKLW